MPISSFGSLLMWPLKWEVQSSKKTNNVRDPNLSMKMSDFHISVNNSQIRMIFPMKVVLKLIFINLWSVAIILCAISSKKICQMSIIVSDFLFQPKMSGFLQNNVRDPRSQDPDFLELWLMPSIMATSLHWRMHSARTNYSVFISKKISASTDGCIDSM